MAKVRRLTINPPLSEDEFAGLCAANRTVKIDREPSGVIIFRRKRKVHEAYVDVLLPRINLADNEGPSGTRVPHLVEDREALQALEALEGRLGRERESSEGAHASALNIAIRSLLAAKDLLESLMAHEQRMPQKLTGRDMDTYDQRREHLNAAYRPLEKDVGRDPTERIAAVSSIDSREEMGSDTAPGVYTETGPKTSQSGRRTKRLRTGAHIRKEKSHK